MIFMNSVIVFRNEKNFLGLSCRDRGGFNIFQKKYPKIVAFRKLCSLYKKHQRNPQFFVQIYKSAKNANLLLTMGANCGKIVSTGKQPRKKQQTKGEKTWNII